MAEPTLGRALAAFAADTPAAALPAAVVDSVRQRVLDVVGLCVAAVDLPSRTHTSRPTATAATVSR
ncbi:hypothetical protein BSA16_29710, partial [Micromonospora sp. Rc5]